MVSEASKMTKKQLNTEIRAVHNIKNDMLKVADNWHLEEKAVELAKKTFNEQ